MQHFFFVGGESEPSKEKLRIQSIIETLCPRLCEVKVILQEIIWSLTPGRCCKKMTQALAERAVEVTSDISHLLEGAKETPQLLDNISQLERTLRDIYVFVQSETQRNLLHRMLFAKDLRVRYFSLDRRLRGLLKPFEQTVKKSLVLSAEPLTTTLQGGHPGVASQLGVVAEVVPPNNTSAVHASSVFHHAKNTVVHDGTFYAAHNLTIKQVQDYNRTPQGIVEGADVFTPGDVLPKEDIYKGRGYRVYSAYSTAKARAVKIKLYEGSCAQDRCLAAANFSQKAMHPNVLHLIGVSPLHSELHFLVFDEGTEWVIESIIASALSKGLKQSLYLGLQTVAGISSGLDYLRSLLYPFASVGLDHFAVGYGHQGNILISFDPEVLPDDTPEQDQRSGESDGGNELVVFHGLCQKTFDAACKAHYECKSFPVSSPNVELMTRTNSEVQKVQRSDVDELDADHDPDQDRFEEIEVGAGTLSVDTNGPTSDVLSLAPSAPQPHATLPTASRRPPRKSIASARRRELVWKSHKNETVSLEDIARQFKSSLLTFSTDLGLNRRRGRYTTKTVHRCPGYNRIEITLTPDIARSAIVSHLTPTPHEICPVCRETVKCAEIFACICGRDDIESIPTIRCSTCSEWHHRPCISMSENKDQSFVCQRCEVQTKPEPNHPDSFGHFTKDAEATYARYTHTAETSPRNTKTSKIYPPFDPFHPPVGTLIDGGSLELVEFLGVGGSGVVYRAVDTRHHGGQKSYAVKCLVVPGHRAARQRQIHIREIALHQLASAHPGVVTLHRVVEQGAHIYIIMDYAPDHDLSTQILHTCRYLGDDVLIKDVFLQLLDAVEYCHSLGIYHRDLKPENILCFDDGLRIGLGDFGLATTDRFSAEFRTGSAYHMSPECQGGAFAPTGSYPPNLSDIWSLGIILLNMVTGRKPWTSATSSDPSFQQYLRDPMGFLPTVLPISPELNNVLIRMLDVDLRDRITLRDVQYAIEEVTSFYSDGVVFEGSIARCPWESGMDIDTDSASSTGTTPEDIGPPSPDPRSPTPKNVYQLLSQNWSKDRTSDIVFESKSLASGSSYGAPWTTHSSCGATHTKSAALYDANCNTTSSSGMSTAIEYDPFSSMFYLNSAPWESQ